MKQARNGVVLGFRARRPLVSLAVVLPLLLLLAGCDLNSLPGEGARDFSNTWQIGSTVRLAKGTEIREGPGIGYCWHTVVPENGWEVRVIGGPRTEDQDQSRIWYDTSRQALGDPSGGTGWILASQANHFPVVPFGGTQCPYSVQRIDNPGDDIFTRLLTLLTSWWRSLPVVGQTSVVVIALALIFFSFVRSSTPEMRLLRAAMFGVLIWWVADQTRSYWQQAWYSLAGYGGADPALVAAFVPLVWWGYSQLRWRVPDALRLLLLAAVVVLGLLWLAPQRLQETLAAVLDLL